MLGAGYQFIFFNAQMDASMLQVSSKHFETTAANYRTQFLIVGMPAEHCTAAGDAAASGAFWVDSDGDNETVKHLQEEASTPGQCADGVSLNWTGLVGAPHVNVSGVPTLRCSDAGQAGASACEVALECRECMVDAANQFAEISASPPLEDGPLMVWCVPAAAELSQRSQAKEWALNTISLASAPTWCKRWL